MCARHLKNTPCRCETETQTHPALGEFYRKYHNELSHIGGNLNQSVKRANELSVAGLLPPEYLREVLMPVIRETQDTLNEIKRELEEVTKKAVKL